MLKNIKKKGKMFTWGESNSLQLGRDVVMPKVNFSSGIADDPNNYNNIKMLSLSQMSILSNTEKETKEGGSYFSGKTKFHDYEPGEVVLYQEGTGKKVVFGDISCGFQHCLALDRERKRIYAWGANGLSFDLIFSCFVLILLTFSKNHRPNWWCFTQPSRPERIDI